MANFPFFVHRFTHYFVKFCCHRRLRTLTNTAVYAMYKKTSALIECDFPKTLGCWWKPYKWGCQSRRYSLYEVYLLNPFERAFLHVIAKYSADWMRFYLKAFTNWRSWDKSWIDFHFTRQCSTGGEAQTNKNLTTVCTIIITIIIIIITIIITIIIIIITIIIFNVFIILCYC